MAMQDQIPDGLQLTPFDADFYADPYPVYQRLQKLDPIHQDTTSFYAQSWSITGYRRVSQLLRDDRLSADPRTIGLRRDPRADNNVTLRQPDMMNLDGAAHQRLRALVQKAFTPTSVKQFRPQIEAIVEGRLDTIVDTPFDVVPTLAKPIPTMVIAAFIGVHSADHIKFKQWTDSLLLQGYPVPTPAQWQEILDADAALRDYMTQVVTQRRQHPQSDLISRLITAQERDTRLTDREVVDMCYLLIGAGNFTTTDLISNAIHQVLSQQRNDGKPNAWNDSTLDECLRIDSPVLAVRRFVTEDVQVDETTIPRGSVVNLLIAAANHDPETFTDAERFAANRKTNPHLSFGRGPHHCLGSALAKLETSITLERLLARYPKLVMNSA